MLTYKVERPAPNQLDVFQFRAGIGFCSTRFRIRNTNLEMESPPHFLGTPPASDKVQQVIQESLTAAKTFLARPTSP